jgi:hypothetical protein
MCQVELCNHSKLQKTAAQCAKGPEVLASWPTDTICGSSRSYLVTIPSNGPCCRITGTKFSPCSCMMW